MRRLLKQKLLWLLGSRGATIIGVGTLSEIVHRLTGGQSLTDSSGPVHERVAKLRQQLTDALFLPGWRPTPSTPKPRIPEQPATGARELAFEANLLALPKRLDSAGAECLRRADEDPSIADDMRGLAAFRAASATLVSRFWIARRQWDLAPFPDDDGTVEFAMRRDVWVPGNEVEIEQGRMPVPWRHLFDDPATGVFLVMGQSNAANHGDGSHAAKERVYSFDFLRLQAYRAVDPLPGASGSGGSVWTRLGDRLIAEGVYRQVLFVPIAFGGTFVTDWIPGGAMHARTQLALSRLRSALSSRFLNFSAVLWQQGEAEANHTQMPASEYQRLFHEIAADLRENGVFAPVFVARSTLCDGGDHPHNNHEAIRSAQVGLASTIGGILMGPDTDTIGTEDRFDGCHLSQNGLQRCADLWFETIAAHRRLLEKI
jgi:hypothetical protein